MTVLEVTQKDFGGKNFIHIRIELLETKFVVQEKLRGGGGAKRRYGYFENSPFFLSSKFFFFGNWTYLTLRKLAVVDEGRLQLFLNVL